MIGNDRSDVKILIPLLLLVAATSADAESVPDAERPIARVFSESIREPDLKRYQDDLLHDVQHLWGSTSAGDNKLAQGIDPQSIAHITQAMILSRLQEAFCRNRDCTLTEEELEMVTKMLSQRVQETTGVNMNIERRERTREFARLVFKNWKFYKALFQQYGGAVETTEFAPTPSGAYVRWLEEEEKKGSFEIYDPSVRALFWKELHEHARNGWEGEELRRRTGETDPWEHAPWDANRAKELKTGGQTPQE